MINLIAPINTLGYGVAGYNITKSLLDFDSRIALYPISQPEESLNDKHIKLAILNQLNIRTDFPCIKIWHQNDLFTSVGNGKYYGFPIFELNQFNDLEKTSMKHCDELFVCSHWAKDIILKNLDFGESKVHVAPLGVDRNLFREKENNPTRPSTIFFNCGKWEKRKGHDILVECFNSAFSENDDVELWMMCENPFIGDYNNKWMELYKESKLGSKVKFIPRQISQSDVYNIMSQVDCGVFPARAEGWNLELLEMLSCGKHVIATNYSAHTEFCNKENSMLVEINNLETAFDGLFFNGEYGYWAEIADTQKDQIITYMRDIHHKKQSGKLSHNLHGIETAKQFSWENTAKEILNVTGL